MKTVIIASFVNPDEAQLLASRLRSAGIATELRDENTAGLNAGYALAMGGVKVAVDEADLADALAILRDAPGSPAE